MNVAQFFFVFIFKFLLSLFCFLSLHLRFHISESVHCWNMVLICIPFLFCFFVLVAGFLMQTDWLGSVCWVNDGQPQNTIGNVGSVHFCKQGRRCSSSFLYDCIFTFLNGQFSIVMLWPRCTNGLQMSKRHLEQWSLGKMLKRTMVPCLKLTSGFTFKNARWSLVWSLSHAVAVM